MMVLEALRDMESGDEDALDETRTMLLFRRRYRSSPLILRHPSMPWVLKIEHPHKADAATAEKLRTFLQSPPSRSVEATRQCAVSEEFDLRPSAGPPRRRLSWPLVVASAFAVGLL